MQKVKWLYAAFFALSFALIVEWTGSFTVQRNLSWLFGLSLPVFWLDTTAFTALFSAATALEAFVVSDALVKDACMHRSSFRPHCSLRCFSRQEILFWDLSQ